MEGADFSGYATKAGLKCSDGRTIMPNAFQNDDGQRVPLVWQHGHNDPENVLGHAILESRDDGVYAYGFFNNTPKAQGAKIIVQHKDVSHLSIYANQLVEKSKQVLHGKIREVSLVLSGANPGAMIDYVSIAHADGEIEVLDDAARIFADDSELVISHTEELSTQEEEREEEVVHSGTTVDDPQAVYDAFSDEQREVVHYMIGAAVEEATGNVSHASTSNEDETVQDVYDSMSQKQKDVVHFMIGVALEEASASASHSDTTNKDESLTHQEGNDDMGRNVFDQTDSKSSGPTLSHDQLKTIMEDAQKSGSFKEAFLAHAAEYGIEDIDILFPDAKAVSNSPEFISRRQEWVADVINSTKHSPFSRIKSTAADITADEARARGYVKGNRKKDEIIKLLKRVTTPTTIYKKQKLDRDDIVDITDLDVVAWLKAEMRLMLDEELARAILIGDGREPDDEDKIDEDKLRPIAFDDDMYSHKVTLDTNVSPNGIVEAVLRARQYYKGTGTPVLYTTDAILTDLMLIKDKVDRRLYETEAALAAAMRVSRIVAVEVMESQPEILGILVNLSDYTVGADQGGQVSMFDDFDIDYNQFKYLMEVRASGALTKPKSAVVVRRTVGQTVTPQTPSYNGTTHTITIPTQTGVVYAIDGVTKTGDVVITETTDVDASPAEGYSFPHNTVSEWTYTYTA